MIHFLPLAADCAPDQGDDEMVLRLTGLKRALRLVDPFGGGPAPDFEEETFAAAFAGVCPPVRSCFDRRSQTYVGAAAAGLEAVATQRCSGSEPNPSSLDAIGREIRAALADLSSLIRL